VEPTPLRWHFTARLLAIKAVSRTRCHGTGRVHASRRNGSEEIGACVPEGRDTEPVQPFGTFTPDLYALAGWLTACRIATVALESTGVYGIPVYEMLEARGFQVHLVNARHPTHGPGHKSDVKNCQWIQHLHTCGLLSGSCRPEAEMCAVRAYVRHRATWIA
jgi:transposase